MMERLSQVAARLGAPLRGDDRAFERVVTDSRQLQEGDLFVALQGERFDGHDFLAEAARRGAAGALVAQGRDDAALPQVIVPDTLVGLQAYAAAWRADHDLPVIGLTGSAGKTTTKQMLASIVAQRGPVLATLGNLNNHIGVPLTLLGLRAEHRTAVVEMGANHVGEIAHLAELARPQIGIVTQAGDAHLEGFGSRDNIARGKGELFERLGEGGIAIINADDSYADLWRQLAGSAAVLSFGTGADADVRAASIEAFPERTPTGIRFELRVPEGRITVALPLPGRHNVSNALAAAAAALALGMDLHDIGAGLEAVRPVAGRLSWQHTPEGAQVLDDTYNANPTSLRAALDVLAQMPGERWLVLGDMAELGPDAARLHLEAGQMARAFGIARVYTLGVLAAEASRGFGSGAQHFDDIAALTRVLRPELRPQVRVLVKGSRSARMERVVAALTGQAHEETH